MPSFDRFANARHPGVDPRAVTGGTDGTLGRFGDPLNSCAKHVSTARAVRRNCSITRWFGIPNGFLLESGQVLDVTRRWQLPARVDRRSLCGESTPPTVGFDSRDSADLASNR